VACLHEVESNTHQNQRTGAGRWQTNAPRLQLGLRHPSLETLLVKLLRVLRLSQIVAAAAAVEKDEVEAAVKRIATDPWAILSHPLLGGGRV